MPSSNIDQWISEFPLQRDFIINNQRLFEDIRPPRNLQIGDEQWKMLTQSLQQPDAS